MIIDEPYEASQRDRMFSGDFRGHAYQSRSSKIDILFCASSRAPTRVRRWSLVFSVYGKFLSFIEQESPRATANINRCILSSGVYPTEFPHTWHTVGCDLIWECNQSLRNVWKNPIAFWRLARKSAVWLTQSWFIYRSINKSFMSIYFWPRWFFNWD